jgi:Na+/H+ antiporter NhaC
MLVDACPNGEPESMYALMWGGLLQDTVSPLGDMVHYLAKASFLQDMLLGMFVWFLFFLFFLYVIIFALHLLPRQALHLYNIYCIAVTKLRELHWWHHFKIKVKGQGHIMVKVGCQRNPYFLSSFYQINSKLGVQVASEVPLS